MTKGIKISKERIIKELKEAYDKHGHFLKSHTKKYTSFNIEHIIYIFGSIDKFEVESNIKFKSRETEKERIIKELKEAYDKHGPFQKKDIKKYTSFDKGYVWYIFGSVDELEEKANIKFKKSVPYIRTKQIKNKTSSAFKGRTMEDILGSEEKAKIRNKKISEKNKGHTRNAKFNIDKVVKELQEKFKIHGAFYKKDFDKIITHCSIVTVRNNIGSIDKLAELAGVRFKQWHSIGRRSRTGKHEKPILDNIELEKGVLIERQFPVAGKFLDGYDALNNIAYEIDEEHHKYQKVEDYIREQKVKAQLNCEFVRIDVKIKEGEMK